MTPNGAKLVVKLIERYNNQIVTICLHLPDANKNMKGWKYSKDYEESFNILSGANVDCGILKMTMDGSGEIHPDIKHLTNINHDFKGHTRADSLDVAQVKDQPIVQTPHHKGKITCASTPFYDKNVLLPNGDVVLCCMDYSLKHIIGNLIKQNYAEIFNSKEFLMIVETNENSGFSKCSICKSCDNITPIGFKSKIKKFIPKPIRKFI